MKCSRCAAEISGQAQFCMKCGSPVAVAHPGGSVTMARPAGAYVARPGPNKGLIAAGVLATALLLGGGLFAARYLSGSRVAERQGLTPNGGPLTDKAGRISEAGPLTDRTGAITPTPSEPTDVIDYLKFLKDIERQRVLLTKRQVGEVLGLTATVQGSNILSQMNEKESEISKAENETYGGFQKKLSEWPKQWDTLSHQFLSKQAPQSCALLRDKYYDALSKCGVGVIQVGNLFSQAMGGDPSQALVKLQQMGGSGMGSASKEADDACTAADRELGAVCDKFRVNKEFDIKPDGGGTNLFGGLGGIH